MNENSQRLSQGRESSGFSLVLIPTEPAALPWPPWPVPWRSTETQLVLPWISCCFIPPCLLVSLLFLFYLTVTERIHWDDFFHYNVWALWGQVCVWIWVLWVDVEMKWRKAYLLSNLKRCKLLLYFLFYLILKMQWGVHLLANELWWNVRDMIVVNLSFRNSQSEHGRELYVCLWAGRLHRAVWGSHALLWRS